MSKITPLPPTRSEKRRDYTPGFAGRGDLGGDGGVGNEAEGVVRRADSETGAARLGQIHHQGEGNREAGLGLGLFKPALTVYRHSWEGIFGEAVLA